MSVGAINLKKKCERVRRFLPFSKMSSSMGSNRGGVLVWNSYFGSPRRILRAKRGGFKRRRQKKCTCGREGGGGGKENRQSVNNGAGRPQKPVGVSKRITIHLEECFNTSSCKKVGEKLLKRRAQCWWLLSF